MSALFWRRIIKIGIRLDCSIFPVKIHIILSNYLHKHLRIGSTGICVSALQDPSIASIPGLSLPWLAWNLPRKCLLACQAHCHGSSAIRCSPDIKIKKSNTEGILESSVAVQPKTIKNIFTQRFKVYLYLSFFHELSTQIMTHLSSLQLSPISGLL